MKKPIYYLLAVSFTSIACGLCPDAIADPDLDAGLIAYWPLDGNLNDVVGEHHGEARGVTELAFVGNPGMGQAVYLDGISQFIEIVGGDENVFDFEDESMSVSIWFTMDRGATAQTLIGKGGTSSWRLAQSGDNRVLTFAGVQGTSLKGPTFRRHGELHHAVAMTDHENSATRFYIDGELVAEEGHPRSTNADKRLTIGIHPENSTRIWRGLADDVAIWDRPITEEEVAALWNGGAPLPVGAHLLDADSDQIPDFWETANGISAFTANGDDDPDEDALSNLDEFVLGTDPQNPDTDGDGLADGVESGTGTWISVGNTGTDPLSKDSDGDNLPDGLENPDLPNEGLLQPGTDPNLADTDNDGIGDRDEPIEIYDPSFRIGDMFIEGGRLHISVPGASNEHYYTLYRSETLEELGKPVAMLSGNGAELDVVTPTLEGRDFYYRVKRFPRAIPHDLDRDGFDDVTELDNSGVQSPLNAAQFVKPEDGSVMIPNVALFDSFSVADARGLDAASGTTQQPRIIKLIVSIQGRREPHAWFVNTTRHAVHESFLSRTGVPCTGNCVKVEIIQYPGLQLKNGNIGLYTIRMDGVNSFSTRQTVYEHVAVNMPVSTGRLALHVIKPDQQWYSRNRTRFHDAGIPVVLDDDLLGDNAYVGLNHAEAFGRLRIIETGERPALTDIALFRTIPNDIPHIAGIITELPQTPLSHVNLRAVQNNAPNAYIRDATSTPEIRDLLGKNVYFKVTGAGFEIREASQSELDAFFESLRPVNPQTPVRNLESTNILNLDSVIFADSDAFGVKAANFAELKTLTSMPEGTVPDGFAVPFHFYHEFMEHNELYDRARRIISEPSFQKDPEIRDIALRSFRREIRNGKMPDWMITSLSTVQDSFAPGESIRCRSSTNNEDLPGFNGAGLYDSFTHHPDEGHLSKTVKQVFASLWNLRAFEERDFYRIDHFTAAMGILIHPSFSNEMVNGVAVSKNILFGAGSTARNTFYLNAQIGEELVTNPEGAAVPEEILTNPDGTEVTYLRGSNRVPDDTRILSRAKIRRLAGYLQSIRTHFRGLYDGDSNFAIEIEFKVSEDGTIIVKQARPWVE